MGSGFSKMKKQARMLEEQFEKMQEEMKAKEVTGSSGNGLVTITMSGDKEIKKVQIKPECVDLQDLEGLEDLITAACADAYRQIGQNASADGMGLPFGF